MLFDFSQRSAHSHRSHANVEIVFSFSASYYFTLSFPWAEIQREAKDLSFGLPQYVHSFEDGFTYGRLQPPHSLSCFSFILRDSLVNTGVPHEVHWTILLIFPLAKAAMKLLLQSGH